jgi:hypothetical protein
MAAILRANGTRDPLDTRTAGLTLDAMHAIVGGFVEFVWIGGTDTAREVLIVNEDGLRLGLPVNPAATFLYRGIPARHEGVIVGDVILATVHDPGQATERVL